MPVIFITDFLIFLLLFGVVAFFFYGRKQEHLAAPWRDVRKRSLAMSSAVILFFFVCIGLFDSIHFHPKIETDKSTEKIYSNEINFDFSTSQTLTFKVLESMTELSMINLSS